MAHRTRRLFLSGALILAGLVGLPIWAQSSSDRGVTNSVGRKGEQSTIRVATKEVVVPVTVLDTHGEPVLDLEQHEFHVFDEGQEQRITNWELGGDQLSIALVIETSSHLRPFAAVIQSAGSLFTETVMALNGEAAVITYDATVEIRQPFTQDHDAIERAIKEIKFQAPEMKLYDAMATAVHLLKDRASGRRVMLILGESQDVASDTSLKKVVQDALRADIAIYVVGPSSTVADLRNAPGGPSPIKTGKHGPSITVSPAGPDLAGHPRADVLTPAFWLVMRGANEIKNHELELAASATGGVHYRAMRAESIRSALDRVGAELHCQYVLTYLPDSANPPLESAETDEVLAGYHAINVTVSRPGLVVRSRPGYYIR